MRAGHMNLKHKKKTVQRYICDGGRCERLRRRGCQDIHKTMPTRPARSVRHVGGHLAAWSPW